MHALTRIEMHQAKMVNAMRRHPEIVQGTTARQDHALGPCKSPCYVDFFFPISRETAKRTFPEKRRQHHFPVPPHPGLTRPGALPGHPHTPGAHGKREAGLPGVASLAFAVATDGGFHGFHGFSSGGAGGGLRGQPGRAGVAWGAGAQRASLLCFGALQGN